MTEVSAFLEESRARIDAALDAGLPPASSPPAALHEAMRYAVFSGGKRLRPALAFAAAKAVGAEPDAVCPVAAAVEIVHTYSLVHDDLPAMDNDDERRGRPTVHVQFGEANAILTGDALLAEAFGVLARADVPAVVIARLAEAAGGRELVGGQVDDLGFETNAATLGLVQSVHERKTAALFRFAAWGAARTVGAKGDELLALDDYARHYGLAFQGTDDLLDTGDDAECSLLRVMSPAAARDHVLDQIRQTREAIGNFGSAADALRGLAEALSGRLA